MSASTQNQAFCAEMFLYRLLIYRPLGHIAWARVGQARRTPAGGPDAERGGRRERAVVGSLLAGVALLYCAGLRPSECLELRVKDLGVAGGRVAVRSGKGRGVRRTEWRSDGRPESGRCAVSGQPVSAAIFCGHGQRRLPDAMC